MNCAKCNNLQNAQYFPFGLESIYDLSNINMSHSMNAVEMILKQILKYWSSITCVQMTSIKT